MKKIQSYLELPKIATPSSPDSDHTLVYPKSDGKLYYVNSDGVETAVTGSGASPGIFESYAATGRYMSRASSSSFDIGSPSKFTVRMWFRPLTPNSNNGLATRAAFPGNQGDWAVGFFNGTTMAPTFRLNSNATSVQSTTVLTIGTWYFLEFSYDSSLGSNNVKIFISGVLDTQANYSTVITNNAVQLVLGSYFDTNHCMVGHISEFEFSKGVVRNTAGYTPPATITADANTTLLWKFTKGAVTTDSSGNGFTGTVNGATYADTAMR